MPARSRCIAVVAHCHLNANTKVHGLAGYGGVRPGLLGELTESGAGIVQLPCPEATFLGMKRWGMTVEQYDTPAYRRHCAELLAPVVDTLVVLSADGCEIEGVWGVDGSPSCGVERTCAGYTGGEVEEFAAADRVPVAHDAEGPGVFIAVLRELLGKADLAPPFIGISERDVTDDGRS